MKSEEYIASVFIFLEKEAICWLRLWLWSTAMKRWRRITFWEWGELWARKKDSQDPEGLAEVGGCELEVELCYCIISCSLQQSSVGRRRWLVWTSTVGLQLGKMWHCEVDAVENQVGKVFCTGFIAINTKRNQWLSQKDRCAYWKDKKCQYGRITSTQVCIS